MTYRVAGDPTPDQQADRIRKLLGTVQGVDPASIEVTQSEIRFRTSNRDLSAVLPTLKALGYQVKSTLGQPLQ